MCCAGKTGWMSTFALGDWKGWMVSRCTQTPSGQSETIDCSTDHDEFISLQRAVRCCRRELLLQVETRER